jgi:hypothetical protein
VTIPALSSLAMVVYSPPVQDADSTKSLASSSLGKSSYPLSSLGNFTHFSTLTDDEIVRLIEGYGVIFHTSDDKKT